jgi:solute carrier family 44 (choline transporter-like protein), member 2/4/5
MPKLKSKKKKFQITNKITDINENKPVTLQDVYERELVSKRHNCTDIICLLIFIVFGIGQVILSIVIFTRGGNPQNVLLPHDSAGNVCSGSTSNLFYFNLAACLSVSSLVGSCPTTTSCVSNCPNQNLFYLIESQRNVLLSDYCLKSKLNSYYNNKVPSSIDSNAYLNLINANICPAYALVSNAFYSRCLPTLISSVVNGVTNQLIASDSNQTLNITDINSNPITGNIISKGAQYVTSLLNIKTTG